MIPTTAYGTVLFNGTRDCPGLYRDRQGRSVQDPRLLLNYRALERCGQPDEHTALKPAQGAGSPVPRES